MEGDGFLNGFGWVLPVILIVSLLSFGFRYLQRGPPEALRLAWAILGLMTVLAGLVVTLVLEMPLSEDLATAREVAFWVLIPALLWARSKHRALVGER